MKIVINVCFGGFGLSRRAFLMLRKLGQKDALAEPDLGEKWENGSIREGVFSSEAFLYSIARDDPLLIKVVEKLGKKANGSCAELRIIKIPNGIEWEISEYDGMESVHEKHKSWS